MREHRPPFDPPPRSFGWATTHPMCCRSHFAPPTHGISAATKLRGRFLITFGAIPLHLKASKGFALTVPKSSRTRRPRSPATLR
jgi:hypothetical protein